MILVQMEANTLPRLAAIERSGLKIGSFVDLATSTKNRADYTVIATVGIDALQNIFILNIHRGRWEWPDAFQAIVQEVLSQKVRLLGVETAGYQLSSFQELIRDSRLKNLAIFPVPVNSDKVSRSLLVSARAANGKLYYDRRGAWAETLISEFVNFPGGRHDDILDAVCGCVELLNNFQAAAPVVSPGVSVGRSKWKR